MGEGQSTADPDSVSEHGNGGKGGDSLNGKQFHQLPVFIIHLLPGQKFKMPSRLPKKLLTRRKTVAEKQGGRMGTHKFDVEQFEEDRKDEDDR